VIRAVLDANVLVSGFPARSGTPATLIERWLRREFELVLSLHIIERVAATWTSDRYFASRYSAGQAQRAVDLLLRRAILVMPVTTVQGIADDEEDDLVLATAVAGQASYLVTGDHGLQRLGTYQGVAIVSPRAFLDLLEQQGHNMPQ
jgi:putative PIN family toxin of toxin-antitoxin system